jgi:hypothetical protein
MQFYGIGDFRGFWDNVSVKEVNPKGSAFSTRLVNSDYTGYAMRVRNNDDNIEAEVSFDSNNEISLDSPVKATSMNLLGFSEDFGQWAINGGTVGKVQSGIADPFGGNNAWEIESKTYNYSGLQLLVTSGLTTGDNVTVSGYFRKSTSSLTRFGLYDSNTSPYWGSVDIAWSGTGVPSTSSSSRASNINYEAIGSDGWYRVSFTTTVLNISGSDQSIIIQPDRNATNKSVYAFGAQLEETVYESTPSGSELVTNGTFDDDISSWTQMTGATIAYSNGTINVQPTNYIGAQQFVGVSQNTSYRITFDVVSTTSSTGRIYIGTSSDKDAYGNHSGLAVGTHTFDVTTINNSFIQLRLSTANASGNVNFDNVSVKELTNLSPSTYSQTPVISDTINNTTAVTLGEFSGKENKLTHSEDFSNGSFSKINSGIQDASQIVDPFGGYNAVRLAADTTNGQHRLDIASSVGTEAHTFSVYAKAAEMGQFFLMVEIIIQLSLP